MSIFALTVLFYGISSFAAEIASISAGVAEVIEYLAISRHLWTYSPLNPTLSGVSMAPIFQMAIINPLTIFGVKKLLLLTGSDKIKRATNDPN